jgi:hypothetical protein
MSGMPGLEEKLGEWRARLIEVRTRLRMRLADGDGASTEEVASLRSEAVRLRNLIEHWSEPHNHREG